MRTSSQFSKLGIPLLVVSILIGVAVILAITVSNKPRTKGELISSETRKDGTFTIVYFLGPSGWMYQHFNPIPGQAVITFQPNFYQSLETETFKKRYLKSDTLEEVFIEAPCTRPLQTFCVFLTCWMFRVAATLLRSFSQICSCNFVLSILKTCTENDRTFFADKCELELFALTLFICYYKIAL